MVIDSNSLSLIAGSRVVYAAVDLVIGDQEKIMRLLLLAGKKFEYCLMKAGIAIDVFGFDFGCSVWFGRGLGLMTTGIVDEEY